MGVSEYCETHGVEKEHIAFGQKEFWHCHECGVEQGKEEQLALYRESTKKDQSLINKRLDNAMILPRFKSKTLDNFIATLEGQKKAKGVSVWFLDNLENVTGLIFLGSPGTGKNHLATGIIKSAIEEYDKTALITETIKIIRAIKESWRKDGDTESQVIKSFIDPDILVIDEVGVQFGSDTERMYLTEIINDRYNHKKPTILLSNLNKNGLTEIIGERALDRFREGGKLFVFDWESYRSKV